MSLQFSDRITPRKNWSKVAAAVAICLAVVGLLAAVGMALSGCGSTAPATSWPEAGGIRGKKEAA